MESLSINDYILIGGFVLFVGVGLFIELKEGIIIPIIKKYF